MHTRKVVVPVVQRSYRGVYYVRLCSCNDSLSEYEHDVQSLSNVTTKLTVDHRPTNALAIDVLTKEKKRKRKKKRIVKITRVTDTGKSV